MTKALFSKLKEALISVLPVVLIVVAMYFTPLIDLTSKELIVFLICAIFLILGIGLFNLGADLSMTPIGEHVGSGLAKTGKLRVLLSAVPRLLPALFAFFEFPPQALLFSAHQQSVLLPQPYAAPLPDS